MSDQNPFAPPTTPQQPSGLPTNGWSPNAYEAYGYSTVPPMPPMPPTPPNPKRRRKIIVSAVVAEVFRLRHQRLDFD